MSLKREDLTEARLQDLIREVAPTGAYRFLTPEERAASLDRILAELPAGEDIWLFGYGSLMWNPAFHHVEERPALLHGFHRRFCLWTPLGRGTPEQPGLTLALEPGGRCHGIAFRIEASKVREEMNIVWLREMLSGAYRPRWVTLGSAQGALRAVTFTINRSHERYAGRMCPDATAGTLAAACGRIGTCREYLEKSIEALARIGVRDRYMDDLHRRIQVLAGRPPIVALEA
ncbi:gamma-glutamylcyclotransferase [Zavarzinia sp. CC-PAN008]|uniref:gamma-glutamylcyclotransferase n=1 Tax=Zavarzinia sp. CC-PAN008 TaxID=3243332 RepID=UPI003F7477EC